MIRRVSRQGISILLIEHHMDMLMAVSDEITVLDFGRKIAEGPPERIQNDPTVIGAYLGTQTVPRIVGEGHALDILLTGRRIDARLAERLGMVGSVVPGDRLRREADRLAGRLTNIEGKLSAAAKRLVMRGLDLPLDAALAVERATARRFS